ncbi:SHOCT domain-containing protein [Selenomonas sp.]|uniref:SHOCT domain-containing protein n=1 Tax=Selenomonas sp. TaxID=2053611 RepID=UPI002A7FEDF1|nr:SHOCT domain-containing protein [Selenomonas sp.]MDY4416695.1 SHOCT domain-containing protein [Selenomonas sp.]
MYDAKERYIWSYKLGRWVGKDETSPSPQAKETTKRIVDESEVPEVVRKHIHAQERLQTDGDTWSYKLGRWIKKDDTHNHPMAEYPQESVSEAKQAPEASADQDKTIDAINKLGNLYKIGILTEEEFTAKKKELLSRL